MELQKNNYGTYYYVPCRKKEYKKGTIVFIHGYATTSTYHDDFFIKHINNTYDYYAIQLPGHGNCEYPESKKVSINELTLYACKLIKSLDLGKIFLMGHSMGGGIGIRVAGLLKKDVLAYVAVTPMNSHLPVKSIFNYWKFAPTKFKQTLKLNMRIYNDFFKTIGQENVENFINAETEYQSKHHPFFKKLKKKMFSLSNVQDCRRAEKLLDVPTLFIAGRHDKLISERSVHKLYSKSNKLLTSFEIFENSGHLPFQEEEEAYAKTVINFFDFIIEKKS